MILCSGAFDGLHAGHVAYLEAAKALCEGDELLVCAIAPDSYIQQSKGRAPYWHQADRLRTVTALGCIDAAIPQVRQSVADLIHQHRPRLFIKGPDWEGRLPEDIQNACTAVGTSIGYVETPGRHVSDARISDEAALAQFETLVLSQQPASVPWAPVTDYSFEARKEIEGRHPQLILDVFQAARIVDAGMGPGHLVRLLRELQGLETAAMSSGRWVFGFDTQRGGTCQGDLTQSYCGGWPLYRPKMADLVICREVLEHLTIRQIRRAVVNLCSLSSKYVYLTTRFAQSPAHLLSVDTSDDLDPTHCSMLNQCFLRTLFVLEGFRRRSDLEERLDWMNKKRVLVYERGT